MTLPEDVAAAVRSLGLDPTAWRNLSVAVLLEAVLADGRRTPEELDLLLRTSSNPDLYTKLASEPSLRQAALKVLDQVLAALPPEVAEGFAEDLHAALDELSQAWAPRQFAARQLILPEAFAGSEMGPQSRNWQVLAELKKRYPLTRPREDRRQSAKLPDELSASSLLQVPRDRRDQDWAAQCLALLQKAADFLERRRNTPGVNFSRVRTIADLANTGFSRVVYHRGVGFVPAAATRGKTVYFVGDVHGDLSIVARVLDVSEVLRCEDRMLVFCGDYIDRGPASLEVLLAVISALLQCPERVVVLRGNHDGLALDRRQDPPSWRQETTHRDLLEELDQHKALVAGPDQRVHRLIRRIFMALPTFLLLEHGICACHGGPIPRLPNQTNLKGVVNPKYRKKVSVEGIRDLGKPEVQRVARWIRTDFREETLFVWNGSQPPTAFDFADVDAFLQCVGGRSLIRGHDHVSEGFRQSPERPELVTLYTSCVEVLPETTPEPKIARCDEGTGWKPEPVSLRCALGRRSNEERPRAEAPGGSC